jgi:DNA-binding NtrC family response regulator
MKWITTPGETSGGESSAARECQAAEQAGLSPLNAARVSTGAMTNAIKTGTLLFVGAAEGDGLSLGAILRDSGWQLHGARNCQEALEFLDQHRISVVLSEAELPDGNWRELLNSMAKLAAPPNLVVSSRLADDRLWAEVLNLGGFDVLMTPFETEEVLRVTFGARQNWQSSAEGFFCV